MLNQHHLLNIQLKDDARRNEHFIILRCSPNNLRMTIRSRMMLKIYCTVVRVTLTHNNTSNSSLLKEIGNKRKNIGIWWSIPIPINRLRQNSPPLKCNFYLWPLENVTDQALHTAYIKMVLAT